MIVCACVNCVYTHTVYMCVCVCVCVCVIAVTTGGSLFLVCINTTMSVYLVLFPFCSQKLPEVIDLDKVTDDRTKLGRQLQVVMSCILFVGFISHMITA